MLRFHWSHLLWHSPVSPTKIKEEKTQTNKQARKMFRRKIQNKISNYAQMIQSFRKSIEGCSIRFCAFQKFYFIFVFPFPLQTFDAWYRKHKTNKPITLRFFKFTDSIIFLYWIDFVALCAIDYIHLDWFSFDCWGSIM